MPAGLMLNLAYYKMVRLLAVPFWSVKGASESRVYIRPDWSERMSQVETGGEASSPAPLGSHYFRSLG